MAIIGAIILRYFSRARNWYTFLKRYPFGSQRFHELRPARRAILIFVHNNVSKFFRSCKSFHALTLLSRQIDKYFAIVEYLYIAARMLLKSYTTLITLTRTSNISSMMYFTSSIGYRKPIPTETDLFPLFVNRPHHLKGVYEHHYLTRHEKTPASRRGCGEKSVSRAPRVVELLLKALASGESLVHPLQLATRLLGRCFATIAQIKSDVDEPSGSLLLFIICGYAAACSGPCGIAPSSHHESAAPPKKVSLLLASCRVAL